ncbi:MAG: MBL fold metallo-hydrolase [Desulfobacterales bacterium]
MTEISVIEEVAEDTHRLEVRIHDARYIFSVYLLTGKEPVLIDPGPTVVVPAILDAMTQLGIPQLSTIIPTHIHMDHGGGAGTLAERFPQAKVVLHPRGARHAIDPSRLIAGTKAAYEDDFEHTYGPILPIRESQVLVAEDGDVIDAGGRRLRIIHAPGHAAHHMAIFDEKTGGLFCGEALGQPIPGTRSDVLPSISVGDLDVDRYLSSIEKLSRLSPRVLFYPHEGGAREPGDILSRIAENTAMLRDIILEGLRNSLSTGDIERQILDRLAGHPDKGEDTIGMESIILGYGAYFKKKGLI